MNTHKNINGTLMTQFFFCGVFENLSKKFFTAHAVKRSENWND